MSAYTPGPWVVATEGQWVEDEDGIDIADCGSASRSIPERQANAKLITAAPDMTEALKLSAHGPHRNPDGSWDCLCGQCDFVRAKHAALRKAGVQP